jgi:hypothetical protein
MKNKNSLRLVITLLTIIFAIQCGVKKGDVSNKKDDKEKQKGIGIDKLDQNSKNVEKKGSIENIYPTINDLYKALKEGKITLTHSIAKNFVNQQKKGSITSKDLKNFKDQGVTDEILITLAQQSVIDNKDEGYENLPKAALEKMIANTDPKKISDSVFIALAKKLYTPDKNNTEDLKYNDLQKKLLKKCRVSFKEFKAHQEQIKKYFNNELIKVIVEQIPEVSDDNSEFAEIYDILLNDGFDKEIRALLIGKIKSLSYNTFITNLQDSKNLENVKRRSQDGTQEFKKKKIETAEMKALIDKIKNKTTNNQVQQINEKLTELGYIAKEAK